MVDSPATFEMAALNSALDNFPSPEIRLDRSGRWELKKIITINL